MVGYEKFKSDINSLIDIDLNYYKEKQMKRRISSLLNRNDFDDFDSYFLSLKKDEKLLNQFINYLTINVSEFYRNASQWKVLEDCIIPFLIGENKKQLKIWSAACSTGEEPYSLVMLMSKFFPLNRIRILATDIDDGAIVKAKEGLYKEKSLENLPEEFVDEYFTKIDNTYHISDKIKKCVEFKKIDLLKDEFENNFDLIICRNALIYFTDDAKELLYNKFNSSLNREGILFVGSTEQIIMSERYKFKSEKTFFYKKM